MEIFGIIIALLLIIGIVMIAGVIITAIVMLVQYAVLIALTAVIPVAIAIAIFRTYMKMREEDFEIWRSVLIPLFPVVCGASSGFGVYIGGFNHEALYYVLFGVNLRSILLFGICFGTGSTLATLAYPFARDGLILYQEKRSVRQQRQHLIKGDY